MTRYRSTGLRMATRHCPRALDFFEAGTPHDRSIFETGIAAHAILQAVAERTNTERRSLLDAEIEQHANATAEALIRDPRRFDGTEEPPLSPDATFEGRELAIDWLLGVERPSPGAEIEVGLALDRSGKPAPYGEPSAYYTGILDQVTVARRTDEETSARVLTIRDYKTSWAADDAELETIQRKGQAVLARPHYLAGVDVLRLEVVNLRTRRIHSRELYFEDDLDAVLDGWQADLWSTLRALDEQKARGQRPARPGAGCMGCPFVLACDHAQDYLETARVPNTAELRAVAYSAAVATVERLSEIVRLDVSDGSIPVPGGVVGFIGKERRQAREDAHVTLSEAWPGADSESVRGLLRAMNPSVMSVEKVAKALHPTRQQKGEREALIASALQSVIVPQFGVHRQVEQETVSHEQPAS